MYYPRLALTIRLAQVDWSYLCGIEDDGTERIRRDLDNTELISGIVAQARTRWRRNRAATKRRQRPCGEVRQKQF